MAHTLPPWSTGYKNDKVFQNADNGEMAARLGSPVTFDRRGNIYWYDDFEYTLNKWDTEISGLGAGVSVSSTSSKTKQHSAELISGSDTFRFARIHKTFLLPTTTGTGLEFGFTFHADLQRITLSLGFYTGAICQMAVIEVHAVDEEIKYIDIGGNYVDTGIVFTPTSSSKTFNTIKLVADRSTGNYSRVLFGKDEVDLTGISMYTINSALAAHFAINIHAYGTAGNNSTIYVDDVIVTQNEP